MVKILSIKHYKKVIDNIMSIKYIKNMDNVLWRSYFNSNAKCNKICGHGLKILLLNAPCNGFGDLIFAIKLRDYLTTWYKAEVTIATTFEKGLLSLGSDPKYVVGLVGGKRNQCRRFKHLKLNKELPEQDLIFIAPMQIDFTPDLKDVKYIIPYANVWNTFTFSEYNDKINKNFTFNTGIGNNRDGIFLTKFITGKKPLELKRPYAVVYVAGSLTNVDRCILSFIEMISKKYYTKHKKLDIVIPSWFTKQKLDTLIKKKISKYYPTIIIKEKDKHPIIINQGYTGSNELTFRCDILPVSNKVMLSLMRYSIDDILLTGDQSITDALSCCYKKNIFYQIAPWKKDLANNLAKNMPNVYLKKTATSCGTLQAIKYKSNYNTFVKKWDFRTRSRKKLDAIILSIIAIKNNKDINKLFQIVSSSNRLSYIKKTVSSLPNFNYTKQVKKSVVRSRKRRSVKRIKK